jgi:multicomponent Na+:H+ antiporter subunit B
VETRPRRRARLLTGALDIALVAAIGGVLFYFLPSLEEGPVLLRDYIRAHGYEETGARNLVSAVYLGYRAFDTLGETIVLLCAVSGSVFLLGERG